MTEDTCLNAVLRCDKPERIVGVVNQLMPTLPAEVRRRLNYAKLHWLSTGGVQGLFDKVNGRTVAQILAEADDLPAPRVVAQGERDGVRFMLYEPPPAE